MVLSVSRRTDIPNYYSEWFLNRIKEGFLYVRNPMNMHQISKINISPDVVDCIVFWTKNPENMMKQLDGLKDYMYYFQFTLTGYDKDMEPNIPDKNDKLITIFQTLSEKIGKERVIWRYDPILINKKYTMEYHKKVFGEIACSLAGYTERVVISFVDLYEKTQRKTKGLELEKMTYDTMNYLAKEIVKIASNNHMIVETCAEEIELKEIGVQHGSCIDKSLIERLLGCKIIGEKDKNQRGECGCLESVEVGTYNTCFNGCKYCYANYNDEKVKESGKLYNVHSPILCGNIGPEDKITDRKVKSLKDIQMSLFD